MSAPYVHGSIVHGSREERQICGSTSGWWAEKLRQMSVTGYCWAAKKNLVCNKWPNQEGIVLCETFQTQRLTLQGFAHVGSLEKPGSQGQSTDIVARGEEDLGPLAFHHKMSKFWGTDGRGCAFQCDHLHSCVNHIGYLECVQFLFICWVFKFNGDYI